jgi:hypothetical protein
VIGPGLALSIVILQHQQQLRVVHRLPEEGKVQKATWARSAIQFPVPKDATGVDGVADAESGAAVHEGLPLALSRVVPLEVPDEADPEAAAVRPRAIAVRALHSVRPSLLDDSVQLRIIPVLPEGVIGGNPIQTYLVVPNIPEGRIP